MGSVTCPSCENRLGRLNDFAFPSRIHCEFCDTALVIEATEKIDHSKATQDALKRLVNFKPECGFPANVKLAYESFYKTAKEKKEARKAANESSFFSESYLYELLGKDDARSLLGRLDRLCRALGFEGYHEL